MTHRKPIEPGCLAIIVRTRRCPENLYRLVYVEGRVYPGDPVGGPDPFMVYGPLAPGEKNGPFWRVVPVDTERPLVVALCSGGRLPSPSGCGIAEGHLMRIDSSSGDDETLEWAGRPPVDDQAFRAKMRRAYRDLRGTYPDRPPPLV